MTDTCAIYTRQSKFTENSESIESQESRCREYAARKGWEVVLVGSDKDIGGAAEKLALRKGLQRVRASYKAGTFTHLVVDDLSRISRDELDSITLQNEFKSIHSVKEGGEVSNKILRAVLNAVNSQYLDNIRVRFDDTHRYRLQKGLHPTGQIIFGYDKNEKGEYVPNAQAKWVKWAFESYIKGMGLRVIANKFNEEGVPTAGKAKAWSNTAVVQVLDKKFYAGLIEWTSIKDGERIEVKGIHEPLVSLATFQAYRKAREERGFKKERKEIVPQFRGLLFCSRCDGPLTEYSDNVMCANYQKYGREVCEGVFTKMDYILEAFNIWFDELEGFKAFTEQLPEQNKKEVELQRAVDNAQAMVDYLEEQYVEYVNFAFEHNINQDIIKKQIETKQKEIDAAKVDLIKAQAELGTIETVELLPWEKWSANQLGTGELSPAEESALYNHYMKQLFTKIVIHPRATNGPRHADRFPASEAAFHFHNGEVFQLTRERLRDRETAHDFEKLYRAIGTELVTKQRLAGAMGYKSDGARSYRTKLARWIERGALVLVPSGRYDKIRVNPQRLENWVPKL